MNAIEMITTVAECLKENGDDDVYSSFTRMIALVAAAHAPSQEAKCVIIYSDGENVVTMGANADASEVIDLCDRLRDSVMKEVMSDAPPKEMFN